MKTVEEMLNMLVYSRLDEIPEEKESSIRFKDFCSGLEGESRRVFNEILDIAVSEKERREKEIYLRGFKDGLGFCDILKKR